MSPLGLYYYIFLLFRFGFDFGWRTDGFRDRLLYIFYLFRFSSFDFGFCLFLLLFSSPFLFRLRLIFVFGRVSRVDDVAFRLFLNPNQYVGVQADDWHLLLPSSGRFAGLGVGTPKFWGRLTVAGLLRDAFFSDATFSVVRSNSFDLNVDDFFDSEGLSGSKGLSWALNHDGRSQFGEVDHWREGVGDFRVDFREDVVDDGFGENIFYDGFGDGDVDVDWTLVVDDLRWG